MMRLHHSHMTGYIPSLILMWEDPDNSPPSPPPAPPPLGCVLTSVSILPEPYLGEEPSVHKVHLLCNCHQKCYLLFITFGQFWYDYTGTELYYHQGVCDHSMAAIIVVFILKAPLSSCSLLLAVCKHPHSNSIKMDLSLQILIQSSSNTLSVCDKLTTLPSPPLPLHISSINPSTSLTHFLNQLVIPYLISSSHIHRSPLLQCYHIWVSLTSQA